MNAPVPPFPLNPFVGQFWQGWMWNGCMWVQAAASGVRVNLQVFTISGPYLPSQGLVTAVVEGVGGGGGGGGAVGTYNGSEGFLVTGGGGSSGGYSRSTFAAAQLAGGVVVTIGAPGAGAAAPVPNASNNLPLGGNGGVTSFGALLIANGGFGGGSANPAGGSPGGVAALGVGQVTVTGNPGHAGMGFLQAPGTGANITGGTGGASYFGGAGLGAWIATNSAPGGPGNSGGGGGGGGSGTLASEPGGAGGGGLLLVTEYCWADTANDPCMPCGDPVARVARTDARWSPPGGFDD
jgi:hypothetical protein